MEFENQMQVDQQSLQRHSNSVESLDMTPERRSANYKPNIWKYDFLQSLSSKYIVRFYFKIMHILFEFRQDSLLQEEKYEGQVEKPKMEVKHIFAEEADTLLAKLELVDSIRKLGLASQFEEEIKEALDAVVLAMKNEELDVGKSLYVTALCFRLLREHGYEVSQDVFRGFMDEAGTHFLESECNDVKGLLELFEASYLVSEGESLLDTANTFSTLRLKLIISENVVRGNNVVESVVHALELPSHWRVLWFDVKWRIDAYERTKKTTKPILDLAKVNFNVVQATLQNDLKHVSRWWRDLGLADRLDFTRDRLVESFLCSVGLLFEPQYSNFRKWITKAVVMVLVIDDLYDIYGSLEELQQFTYAVNRWATREIQGLPDCMKICFQALYNITTETAREMQKEKGWIQVQPHLQKAWADFCNSLFTEAKWYNQGYTPSLPEYLSNAWISSSGTALSVHSFFATINEEIKEIKNFLEKNQDRVYNVSLIIRLCNDLGTSAAEQERGDAASAIVCYTREKNVSEEVARKHLRDIINKAWKKINGQSFTQSPAFPLYLSVNTNMTRVVHNLYQYGDGFGTQDRENKKKIPSLLVESFEID